MDSPNRITLGEHLRRERELRGIALEDVRRVTRVQLDYLRSLEDDAFAALPADVYARGYIRAYARFLGLDPGECIEMYDQQVPAETRTPTMAAILGEERADPSGVRLLGNGVPSGAVASGEAAPRRRGLMLAIVVLLLAALAIGAAYMVNRSSTSGSSSAPSTTENTTFEKPG